MNVLIVYAHPEPKSFNGALKDLAVAALTTEGHQKSDGLHDNRVSKRGLYSNQLKKEYR